MIEFPCFEVDQAADAAYVYLTSESLHDEGVVVRTKAITDSINADYDVYGNVIGLEFLTLKIDLGEEFSTHQIERTIPE